MAPRVYTVFRIMSEPIPVLTGANASLSFFLSTFFLHANNTKYLPWLKSARCSVPLHPCIAKIAFIPVFLLVSSVAFDNSGSSLSEPYFLQSERWPCPSSTVLAVPLFLGPHPTEPHSLTADNTLCRFSSEASTLCSHSKSRNGALWEFINFFQFLALCWIHRGHLNIYGLNEEGEWLHSQSAGFHNL